MHTPNGLFDEATPTVTDNAAVGRSLIGGCWMGGRGAAFEQENDTAGPEEALAFHDVDSAQIHEATMAAAAAFPLGATVNTEKVLLRTADHLEADSVALIETADAETRLGAQRLTGELIRTTSQLRAFAAAIRAHQHLDPVLDIPTPSDPDRVDIRRSNTPLGPVAVWAASNFPFAFGVAGGDTASALAAGCPVIVKAHPAHPETSNRCAAAILAALHDVSAPAGWFSVLHSQTTAPSLDLARQPLIAALAFTGSQTGGMALFAAAAARPTPIPVFAEMGSVNPIVLTPAALAERGTSIAAGLAASVTGSSGQFCTKPGVIFVIDGPETDKFSKALGEIVMAQRIGPMLTPRLRKTFVDQSNRSAALSGVQFVVPTSSMNITDTQRPVLLTVDSNDYRAAGQLQVEHFGPFAIVVRCRDQNDLLDLLAEQGGSLTGTVHTGSAETAVTHDLVKALARFCGRVVYNGYPTGVPVGWATIHGGPFPASTAAASTSVGMAAVSRFQRPLALQTVPDAALPPELQNANPLGILRRVNGQLTTAAVYKASPRD